jgi:cation diffusion facilitator CzcD-associated flavoprotein CzcO
MLRSDTILTIYSFNIHVEAAEWDDAAGIWNIKTKDNDNYQSKYFVLCTGFGSKRYIPAIKGLDKFKGICSHTAAWPLKGIAINGKRTGVIGTGSSGIQLIQEIASDVSQLTVFQRSPTIALPMRPQKFDAEAENRNKARYREFYDFRKRTRTGFQFEAVDKEAESDTPEKRKAFFDQLFDKGGGAFAFSYKDIIINKQANDYAYGYWRDRTRTRIDDPRIAEILAPMEAPFGVTCFLIRWFDSLSKLELFYSVRHEAS